MTQNDQNKTYDLTVLGAGPGGYVAAIRAAQLGLRVVCIDASRTPGGTCLNVGCIPSKVLLHSSQKYYDAEHNFSKYGIKAKEIKADISMMMQHKDEVVKDLGKGIIALFKKNNVDYIRGFASFSGEKKGEMIKINCKKIATNDEIDTKNVSDLDQSDEIWSQNILIATGSSPLKIPNIAFDGDKIISSTEALSLNRVPERMVIVGGGVIGLEIGSVWSRLGSEVLFLERGAHIMGNSDDDIAVSMRKILEKQGMKFFTGSSIVEVIKKQKTQEENHTDKEKTQINKVAVVYKDASGAQNTINDVDNVLIAIGRGANTQGLNLEKIGLKTNKYGQIEVDSNFSTSTPGVYAIGDVIRGPMLAHKASEEGIAAVQIIMGQRPQLNYNAIPAIIYTYPEVATVGYDEQQLKKAGINYKIGKFPLAANSRSRINCSQEGFIKVMTEASTDKILGAAIIADCAGELIQNFVTAIEFGASAEDMSMLFYGHPGVSEAVKESCLAAFSKALHI